MPFELAPDYVDVAARRREFFEKYPDGSLQTVEIKEWWFGDQEYIAYTAAAYRHPDDKRPGYGVAWEPVPGQTPYTRNSELMNAETSAWGRAILAVGGTAKVIASAEEKPKGALQAYLEQIDLLIAQTDVYADWDEAMVSIIGEPRNRTEITSGEARNVKSTLESLVPA